jgi:hypothetical protein
MDDGWLLAAGCWLLAAGCWLMADGWLLADGILSELDATGWTVTGAQWWLVAGGLLPGWLVAAGG